jgi:hypothetical protein
MNFPHAVNVIPPGQSGFMYLDDGSPVISPHAYDQLPLYESWTYKPMRFKSDEIWGDAETWIDLIYPRGLKAKR